MDIFAKSGKVLFLSTIQSLLIIVSFALMLTGCSESEYTLEYSGPSPGTGDAAYPDTPIGKQIKQHITAMSGVGKDAESEYQKSLANMRATAGVTPVLMEVYEALPEEDYFRRTLVVEAMKEMHSEEALSYLERIVNSPIPKDRMPDNTEVNTRESEIVIRVTAVQGLSILARQKSSKADDLLLKLVGHDDLTVRQMAARGYLASSVGNKEEKLGRLRKMLPEEEHWYVTTELTPIKKVQHPNVLPDFDLDAFMKRRSDKAPKTGEVK